MTRPSEAKVVESRHRERRRRNLWDYDGEEQASTRTCW